MSIPGAPVEAECPGGAPPPSPVVHVEPVMGTVASFRLWPAGPADEDRCRDLLGAACARLHEADRIFSTWDPTSLVSRIRRGEAGLVDIPEELTAVIRLCEEATGLTRGWFDPWVMPGGFDPTGLVKGWAIDDALDVLRRPAVAAAMLNVGGDLAVTGRPPTGTSWVVGVRHPVHADALACLVRVDSAVATSGDYEREGHLVDPRTGERVCRAASATVTGPSLALADALATGLAVAGGEGLAFVADAPGYEGMVMSADGGGTATKGFPLVGGPSPEAVTVDQAR